MKPTIYASSKTNRTGNRTEWAEQHNRAINTPRLAHGEVLGRLLDAWALYAQGYKAQFPESKLGDDYVLGEAWKSIGCELRTLLNGPLGRLDGGTLDAFILDTMSAAGVDTEAL